jgi:hypothetical protein
MFPILLSRTEMRLLVAIGLCVGAMACGDDALPPPPPPPPGRVPTEFSPPPTSTSAHGPSIPIELALHDVTMQQAAVELEAELGMTVTIDEDAAPFAECTRLSITTVGRQPLHEVIHCANSAFANHGFNVREREGGLVIVRAPEALPPLSCAEVLAQRQHALAEETARADAIYDRGIRQAADGTYRVSRAALEHLQEHAQSLPGRFVPHVVDGETVGVKIYEIRRTSVWRQLGFQNDDLITDVNGFGVATPASALEAYASVAGADEIIVRGRRRGADITRTYRLVP